jgi:glycosyltransferase 2 family protein
MGHRLVSSNERNNASASGGDPRADQDGSDAVDTAGQSEFIAPARNRRFAWLGIVASALILCASAYVLWRIGREISIEKLTAAFYATERWLMASAALMAAASYLILTGYDALALRQTQLKMPYRITALASFTSYAVSFNLGFPLVTGGAVRYWIYASRGASASQVASLTVIAGITFWLGMGVVLGWTLLTEAEAAAFLFNTKISLVYLAGATSLGIIAAYFVFVGRKTRVVRIQGWRLELPGWRLSLAQMILGIGDICAAAAVLYLLLPVDHGVTYGSFLALYIIAAMLGIAAHTPGGLGVFEATILLALSHLPTEKVLGALLLFRLVYYFVPFVLALAMLGAYEAWSRIKALSKVLKSGDSTRF